PNNVDFSRLKQWMSACEREHRCVDDSGSQNCFPGTRLIDCKTRRVVRAGDDTNGSALAYVALSYVWGPSSSASLAFPISKPGRLRGDLSSHELPEQLPRTIEDAILAVLKLGMQYLRVDKYCIDQADHTGKEEHIRNMDKIYQNASATIVACAGSDSEYGLPGVSGVSRTLQLSSKTTGGTFVSALPALPSVLKASVWATRGWIYQEAILSRRLIFFTDFQVYASCVSLQAECRLWCESHTSPLMIQKPQFTSRGLFLDRNVDLTQLGTSDSGTLRRIQEHIAEYSKRQLSFDSDALNAFSGILAKSSCYSYFGIPFLEEPDIFISAILRARKRSFVMGLFWRRNRQAQGTLCRRRGFPSWSWVGWTGAV
ncbi:heterokaryon incompatibility protein-domain-containing protein, partial [Podospora aff. communis PSN243]